MDTRQVVSPAQDVSLAGTDSQNPMPAAEAVADMTVRAELKSERVQEPQLAQAEGTLTTPFALELAVHPPQPVTLEIFDYKVTITLHGSQAESKAA